MDILGKGRKKPTESGNGVVRRKTASIHRCWRGDAQAAGSEH